MANMSYCRYRNTLLDLQDCADAMDFDIEHSDELDPSEREDMFRLLELCSEIAMLQDRLD